jgi:hypothetical protein
MKSAARSRRRGRSRSDRPAKTVDAVALVEGLPFRFDADTHRYILEGGQVVPHITEMLERGGLVDNTWYTEESSERGRAVHKLTADYDMGALENPASCVSGYKGYLLAHVKAVGIMRPEWLAIEEPRVHSKHRFGGRPDRVCKVYGLASVLEGKTGQEERSHGVQTALQAILEAERLHLPAQAIARLVLYWKPDGRFKLVEMSRERDFDEAYRLIRTYCR